MRDRHSFIHIHIFRNVPVTKRVKFYGKVQGVYFRRRTAESALENGVTGWVKNLPDGSVEAEFSGEAERVQSTIEYCRSRMPVARVDRLEVSDMDFVDHQNFRIRY